MHWRLFAQLHARDWAQNKTRTTLTLLGVALGVATMLAMQILTQNAVDQFEAGMTQVTGKATLDIVPQVGNRLDETLLTRLTPLWKQHIPFTPMVEGLGIWPESPNEALRIVGVDMTHDSETSDFAWRKGDEPDQVYGIFEQGAVYVGEPLAERYNLRRGSTFSLLVNDQRQTFRVLGVLAQKGLGGTASGNLVLMDIGPAQAALGAFGQINRIKVLAPPEQEERIARDLQASLPGNVAVQPAERRGQRVTQLLAAYRINLTALSSIAMMVGVFLIYNTLSIAVLRRRATIGTLRALGESRTRILGAYLAEGGLYGLVGSVLGAGLGIALAYGLKDAVSSTLKIIYTGQELGPLILSPWTLLGMVGVGVLLSVAGALMPAVEASRIAPSVATRPNSEQSALQSLRWTLAALGLVLLGAAIATAYLPPINGVPWGGYLSSTLGMLALALTVPALVAMAFPRLASVLRVLQWPVARLGVLQLFGSLRRSSVAIASLMIAVAMMVSLTIMIHSFRLTVDDWVRQTLRADLFIQPLTSSYSRGAGQLSQAVVRAVQQTPGIVAVQPFLEVPVMVDGVATRLGLGDFETFSRYNGLRFLHGEPGETVLRRVMASPNTTIITEPLATRLKKGRGDTLTLPTADGPKTLRIAGVYSDYTSEEGYLLLPRAQYQPWFPELSGQVTTIAAYLAKDAATEPTRQALLQRLPQGVQLDLRTNRELRNEVFRIFDQTFAITYVMQALALVIAVLTVTSTLMTLVLEGRRELAMLRAVGLTAEKVRALVLTQAAALGATGYALGAVLGYGLALLLVYVVNKQAFGWSIAFTLPWSLLLGSGVALVAVSLASGWWPSRLAARLNTATALREE